MSDIENRPKELFKLPNYSKLPRSEFKVDFASTIGEFLEYDLTDLDGTQPIEGEILNLTNQIIEVNPSKEALSRYEKKGFNFN